MNALESPLEALALNYLSFAFLTVVNNIWTWIAVVTAALSFWKIRASSLPESPKCPDELQPVLLPAEQTTVSPTAASTTMSTAAPQTSLHVSDVATKGKFTAYYGHEDEGPYRNNDVEEEDEVVGEECWFENGWECAMRMRMGDMSWYRFQDLAVIDGNVVRLWDDCRRRQGGKAASLSLGGITW